MFTYVAGTRRPMDVHLWPYFGWDVPHHNTTKTQGIRLLTNLGSAMSGMHLASGNIEQFPPKHNFYVFFFLFVF